MDISHRNGIRDLPWLGFAPPLILALFVLLCLKRFLFNQKRKVSASEHPIVPQIPGLPLIGNLLQLREKKPYKTFAKWAETYGLIYSIKTGASTLVVLNSTQVAKEAMVTRYPSISTRKLSKSLKILTCDKFMVATSDYNEFHKMVKRYIVTSLLGANAQKRYLGHRNTMIENILNYLHDHVKNHLLQAVNFQEVFKNELFGLALKQAVGKDLDSSIYVEELGIRLSREEVFQVLVVAPLSGAIEVDWRDFFPYLRWILNTKLEMKIRNMDFRRQAVMKALIQQHKERTAKEGEIYCYSNSVI